MADVRDRPWEELPRSAADVLRPELPALTQDIIAAIARSIPEYARPLEGSFGRALRVGVEEALERFLRLIADPGARVEEGDVYRALGRGEMREGRSLDALQAAYRLGARVAWRRLAAAGEAAGLPSSTLLLLAEAIFAYIDELASQSVEGYAEAQSDAASERSRRRSRLLEVLVDGHGDPAAIAAAARQADWRVPRTVAGVALERHAEPPAAAAGVPGDVVATAGARPSAGAPATASARHREPEALARKLGPDVLAGWAAGGPCLIVPDPAGPGRPALLRAALGGRPAAIGPAVEPERTARSLDASRRLLELSLRDPAALGAAATAGEPLRVDDHLAALALDAAREPLAVLAARRLAALPARTQAARQRLADTLLAWLELHGSAPAVARRLHVHPQTVRYRLARLREALGDALDDPEARFELQLALRHERLAERRKPPRAPAATP